MATQEQISAALLRMGDASAHDLCLALGISQPTFSRLASGAPGVISYGPRAKVRYTLSAPQDGIASFPLYQVSTEGRISLLGRLMPAIRDRFVMALENAGRTLHDGLPWFLHDLRPQGFIGKQFPVHHPDMGLPESITDWTDRDILVALSRRGDDLPGNIIVGEESLARHLASGAPKNVPHSDYPQMAMQSLNGDVFSSSAGGEQPKFACFHDGRHRIVKFSPPVASTPAARRWADLLVCENVANEVLRSHGFITATTRVFEEQGRVFLESERFDRAQTEGEIDGRVGMISLTMLDAEYAGVGSGWSKTATSLARARYISGQDLQQVIRLELIGRLIGNSDMHHGNLSWLMADLHSLALAPIYDMVPMAFAPSSQGEVADKEILLSPPTPENISDWSVAAAAASDFWTAISCHQMISDDFRVIAKGCSAKIDEMRRFAGRLEPARVGRPLSRP